MTRRLLFVLCALVVFDADRAQDLSAVRGDLARLEPLSTHAVYFPGGRYDVRATIRQIRLLEDQIRRISASLMNLRDDLTLPGDAATRDLQAHRAALAGELRTVLDDIPAKGPIPAATLANLNQLNALVALCDHELAQANVDERSVQRSGPVFRRAEQRCQRLEHLAADQADRLDWAAVVYTMMNRMLMPPAVRR